MMDLLRLLAIVLALFLAARAGGALFDRLRQPRVVGEILGGLALGPMGLGLLSPYLHHALFDEPRVVSTLGWLSWLGLGLLMFNTGLEAKAFGKSTHLKAVAWLIATGTALPLAVGWVMAARLDLSAFYGPAATPFTFGVFLAMAITVTSLPVISRIFEDLGLLGTDFAHVVLEVAVVVDLLLWAGLVALFGLPLGGHSEGGLSVASFGHVLPFLAFAAGRLASSARPGRWPAIAGGRARLTAFFVPLFFAGIGLKLDLLADFPLGIFLLILGLAFGIKSLATLVGGRLAGIGWVPSFHLAIALNARGALGVVLATVGLNAGLITSGFHAVLVLLSLITTQVAGAWLRWVLGRHPRQLELRPSVAVAAAADSEANSAWVARGP